MSAAIQERLQRLLFLIPYVARQGAKGVPIRRAIVAAGYEHDRDFFDDLHLVQMIGPPGGSPDEYVDIAIADGRVFVMLPVGFKRPPRFSLVEAAALLAAAEPLRHSAGGVLETATAKLRQAIPPGCEAALEEFTRAAAFETPQGSKWQAVLASAIDRRMEVSLEYYSPTRGRAAKRLVEPRMLVAHSGHWYLVAWAAKDEKEKLYRLDRIVSAEVGTRCFGRHKGGDDRRFERTVLFFDAELHPEVEVLFSKRLARLAREQWGALARENPDGTVTVKTRMASEAYAVSWALGYGGQVRFVSPAGWQQALERRASELLALHG